MNNIQKLIERELDKKDKNITNLVNRLYYERGDK